MNQKTRLKIQFWIPRFHPTVKIQFLIHRFHLTDQALGYPSVSLILDLTVTDLGQTLREVNLTHL